MNASCLFPFPARVYLLPLVNRPNPLSFINDHDWKQTSRRKQSIHRRNPPRRALPEQNHVPLVAHKEHEYPPLRSVRARHTRETPYRVYLRIQRRHPRQTLPIHFMSRRSGRLGHLVSMAHNLIGREILLRRPGAYCAARPRAATLPASPVVHAAASAAAISFPESPQGFGVTVSNPELETQRFPL